MLHIPALNCVWLWIEGLWIEEVSEVKRRWRREVKTMVMCGGRGGG
jgi:hypothetical protein